MDVFSLMGKIAIETTGANQALDNVSEKGEQTEGKLSKTFKRIAVAAATAFAFKKVKDFGEQLVSSASSAADNIDKMSQKVGVSRKAFQELDFVMSQSGASVDSMQAGMKTLIKKMESGSDSFKMLGISVQNSDGSLRDSESVMWETLEALQGMENGTEKARIASELFGKSGTELLPLLNGTVGSIDEMRKKAHELGIVMDDEAIDAGVAYTDATDQLNRQVTTLKNNMGAALLPTLTRLINKITPLMAKIMPKLTGAFEKVSGAIEPLIETIASALIDAIGWLCDNTEKIAPILATVGAAFAAIMLVMNPIPVIIAAVAAAISFLIVNWGKIKAAVKGGIELVINWAKGIWDKLTQAWDSFKAGIVTVFTAVVDWAAGLGAKLKMGWESIKSGVSTAFTAIADWAAGLAEKLKLGWETIKSGVSTAFTAVAEWAKDVGKKLKEKWDGLKVTLTKAWELLNPSGIVEAIKKWWEGLKTDIANALKVGFSLLPPSVQKAIQDIKDWWKKVTTSVQLSIGFKSDGQGGVAGDGWEYYAQNKLWVNKKTGESTHRTPEGYANGLDFVDRDQMPALLHYGEAVLNRTDAKEWREGSGTGNIMVLAAKLDAVIQALSEGFGNMGQQQVVLDSGALVGQLSSKIDAKLGRMHGYKARGI